MTPIQGRYTYLDNTKYIRDTVSNSLDGGCILLRPKGSGKTTFGKVWLEFFRGNKEFFRDKEISTIMDQPNEGDFVCISLNFSYKIDDITPHIKIEINNALKALGLPEIDSDIVSMGHIFGKLNQILTFRGKRAAIFVDDYDILVRESVGDDYNKAVLFTEQFYSTLGSLRTVEEQGSSTGKFQNPKLSFGERILESFAHTLAAIFVTGSSRIYIDGNSLEDLTMDPRWATVFDSNRNYMLRTQNGR